MVDGRVNDMVSRNKTTKRHSPPSRLRYEASHPTISVRIDRGLYEELKALKAVSGLSVAQVLKVGLEKAQTSTGEAHEKGYRMGLQMGQKQGIQKGKIEGFEAAKKKYAVSYYCTYCGERHLTIESNEEKKAAAVMMSEAGWHDLACKGR